MSSRILILFAHPSQHRSEVNLPLLRAMQQVDAVTVVDLYAEYPDYCIDIDRQQRRLRDHDLIVFMIPLYWYSTPAILEEWQHLVPEYGFAYGHHGRELQDRQLLCAITAGGSEDAYRANGYNHYTIRALPSWTEQMATLCGMDYLPPCALFGARTTFRDGRVGKHVDDRVRLLDRLHRQHLNLELASRADRLKDCIGQITGESR